MRCLQAVGQAEVEKKERYLLANVVNNYIELDDDEQERFSAELEAHKEVKDMVLTWDETIAASRAEGIAEGIAEGEARGQLREARKAVRLLLSHRFGIVPAEIDAKLEAIDDLARLHEILTRVPEVRALDEMEL